MSVWSAVTAWYLGLATHKRVMLALACFVLVVELVLRSVARGSAVYAAWTRFFERIGDVVSGMLLVVVYAVSVGPISLILRLKGDDPLDRKVQPGASAWHPHQPNPLGAESAARHQF